MIVFPQSDLVAALVELLEPEKLSLKDKWISLPNYHTLILTLDKKSISSIVHKLYHIIGNMKMSKI